jgi:hypothetical protein
MIPGGPSPGSGHSVRVPAGSLEGGRVLATGRSILADEVPEYVFEGGYPMPETVQRAYDDADLSRAVQAYRRFFPSVSGLAIFKGNNVLGVVENKVFGTLETSKPSPSTRG